MSLRIDYVGDVAVVDLGSWESTTLAAWRESKPYALLKQGQRHFVVDLRTCPYVGSSMIAEIVAFYWACREAGGDLTVAATQDQKALFELTTLDQVFRIFGSAEEAAASFGHHGE
jgi:anti-anti-sigma factor